MENAVANAVVVKVVLDHLHPHSAVENVVENAVANAVVVQNSRFMGVVVQILQMMRNRCMVVVVVVVVACERTRCFVPNMCAGVARRIITSRAWYLAVENALVVTVVEL